MLNCEEPICLTSATLPGVQGDVSLQLQGSYLPLPLSPDTPALPGRAVFLHLRQNPADHSLDPLSVYRRSNDWVWVQGALRTIFRTACGPQRTSLARVNPGLPLWVRVRC
jgi:hypothetical protein